MKHIEQHCPTYFPLTSALRDEPPNFGGIRLVSMLPYDSCPIGAIRLIVAFRTDQYKKKRGVATAAT